MRSKNTSLLLSSIGLVLSGLWAFVRHTNHWWQSFIDTTTMVGLFLLIIGLICVILASGSFDFFHHSMRYVRQLLRKAPEAHREFDPTSGLSKRFKGTGPTFILSGTTLLIVSILCYGIGSLLITL